jgi:hypothetical protein
MSLSEPLNIIGNIYFGKEVRSTWKNGWLTAQIEAYGLNRSTKLEETFEVFDSMPSHVIYFRVTLAKNT